MNVPKAGIQIFCLMCLFTQIYAYLDTTEHFCGKKLDKTLNELCSLHNGPSKGQRFRRQIVDECCYSSCTRRYLVHNYCQKPSSSVANLLRAQPRPPAKIAHDKGPKQGSLPFPEEIKSLSVGSRQASSDHSHHKKRNCKCRRRRAKRIRMWMKRSPVPPAVIGRIENAQRPFYIF